jgi:glycosyltransferase involved in cell wall biosynthesis
MWDMQLPKLNTRKLIILDPSLKDMGGHFYEYDVAIAAAALRRGMPTEMYAHKSCGAGLAIPEGEILPWFTTEWSVTGGRTRAAMRALLSNLPIFLRIPMTRIGRCVWSQLKKRGQKTLGMDNATNSAAATVFEMEVAAAVRHSMSSADDIIFLPTIRTSELFALWGAVQNTPDFQQLQFHIVLRRDAAEMDLPEDGAPGISHQFRKIKSAPSGKAFKFYCDTEQLCSDYARLSHAFKFRLLPIPFPNPDPDSASLEKWSAGPATKLVYLGGPRVEKGFHLLPHAARTLKGKISGTLLWRLQAPTGGKLEEPEVIEARKLLSSVQDGSIELVERNLNSAEFQSLLLSADIVLLPYLSEFYRARSSGILVQVLAAGKPVIVPSGTWLSSQTDGVGAVEFSEPADFADAVLLAVQRLPELAREARVRAADYAMFHNADALLEVLEDAALQPEYNASRILD